MRVQGVGGITHIVRRNRITNAHVGLWFSGDADARDNVISHVMAALAQDPGTDVTFQRNDVTNFFAAFGSGGRNRNYQCNWWGSQLGPSWPGSPSFPVKIYPWVMQPIAGTDLSCDPSAIPMVIRACATASSAVGAPLTRPTIPLAYEVVAEGGTVKVCDGTHAVHGWPLVKSVTIEAEGPGMPTIISSWESTFTVTGGVGSVPLRGLRFVGSSIANVNVTGAFGSLVVEDSRFEPVNGGVFVSSTGSTGVLIQRNTFVGGRTGVSLNGAKNVTVRENTFDGQSDAGTRFGSQLDQGMTVERNVFKNCGRSWCAGFFGAGRAEIIGNRFEVDISRPIINAIQADVQNGIAIVTDNEIIGTGVGGSNRALGSTYPIQNVAIQVAGRPGTIVSGNRITNAMSGIGFAFFAGNNVIGSDNVITHVYQAFVGGGPEGAITASMTRNDISDYVLSLNAPGSSFTLGDFRCNWWGATGPQNPVIHPNVLFSPHALQPIAGTSTVCSP